MIRLRAARVRFDGTLGLALDALDLTHGERVGITGPNGSGKSTLLRVLAGLQRLSEGTVDGIPRPGRITLAHQRPYFFRGTARSNVAWALRASGRDPEQAAAWLERLGASVCADRPARVLSGGERRRVAIARALAIEPDVLLLDEPHAALDDEGMARVDAAIAAFDGTLVIAAPSLVDVPVSRTVTLAQSSS